MEIKINKLETVTLKLSKDEAVELKIFLEKMDDENRIQGYDDVYKLMTTLEV